MFVRIPTHPGAILREDVIPALRMSVSAVAGALGVSRQTLHKILAEQGPVTPEMAVRLGKFCGDGPGIWIRMQAAHDVAKASIAMAEEVKRIPRARAA
ncbi:MAG: HigA family addiction module antidote protein [Proteobacteria bacterium]|nr:HigA family addiction module antidote protein [Pseudomonadota bacterium]MBI3498235.1 HigA family addiction module antidote protein [Pseudomonadota bacterium]